MEKGESIVSAQWGVQRGVVLGVEKKGGFLLKLGVTPPLLMKNSQCIHCTFSTTKQGMFLFLKCIIVV